MATLENIIRYAITADASKARAEFASVDKAAGKTTATLGGLAKGASKEWGSFDSIIGKVKGSIGEIPVPAGAAAGAIAGIGAAALGAAAGVVALGKAMFDMSKAGSDFGKNIGSFESKTGLTAQTVSTLAYAAKLSGKELSDLQRPMVAFTGLLGKAGDEGSKASEALKKLGITDVHNLDAAFSEALVALNKMPDGIEKMNTAAMLFGKRGGLDMINIAKKTGDSFDAFKAKADALGVNLSERQVQNARDFGKAFNTLGYQIEAISAKFGLEWAPIFTTGMESITKSITRHKPEIDHAITTTGDLMRGIAVVSTSSTTTSAAAWYVWSFDLVTGFGLVKKAAGAAIDVLIKLGAIQRANEAARRVTAKAGAGLSVPGYSTSTAGGGLGSSFGTFKYSGGSSGLPSEDDEGGGGRTGKIKPPKETDTAFRQFFSDLGFNVVRTFGKALNAGSPHVNGGAADVSIRGKSIGDIFTLMEESLRKGYRVFDERLPAPGVKQTGPHIHVENAKTTLSKDSRILGMGFDPDQLAYLNELDKERLGKTPQGQFKKFKADTAEKGTQKFLNSTREQADAALSMVDRWYAAEKKGMDERLGLRRAEAGYAEEILKGQLISGEVDEKEYTERIGALKLAALRDERDAIAEQTSDADKAHKLAILDLEIAKQKKATENDIAGIKKRQADLDEALFAEAQNAKKANQRPGTLKTRTATEGSGSDFADGLFGAMGTEKFKTDAEMMTSTMTRMGQVGGQAINSLANAMGGLVEQWVLTGHMSGKAAKQAVAAAFAMASSQSAVSAIMETAYGIAALTPWGAAIYGPAMFHFKSAAMFGLLAAGTGLIGRGIAGNSANGGTTGTSAASGSSVQSPAPQQPYSRTSSSPYTSGRDTSNDRLAAAIETFNQKIAATPAGHVFMKGMRENPGEVGQQVVRDISSNARIGTDIYRTSTGGR